MRTEAGNPSISQHFARFALHLAWDTLPETVRTTLVTRLLDHLGLVAIGCRTAAGAAAVRCATIESGSTSLLFSSARVTASDAALAHGTLAHVLDFDDTFPDSVIHPTSVVLPAALAASGPSTMLADALSACAPGYELLARIGRDAGRDFHERGFHPTAVLGPLAAALVAGRLLGASEEELVAGVGLAGSMSSGLLEFLSDGTWSKRMHPGWAAQGGLRAAQLATSGFLGPAHIVEGRNGIFRSFLGRAVTDPAGVRDGLGDVWHSQTAAVKLLPCAHVIHPFVEMVRTLRRTEAFTVGDVADVRCRVAPWYVPIVCEPRGEKVRPVSEYQARASLPYVLALELHELGLGLESFEAPVRDDPRLLDLCSRVTCESDPSLARGFSGSVHITLRDGRELAMDASELPRDPDPMCAVTNKLRDNLDNAGHPGLAERLIEATREPKRIRVAELVELTRTSARGGQPNRGARRSTKARTPSRKSGLR